jgi:hypothetical protein
LQARSVDGVEHPDECALDAGRGEDRPVHGHGHAREVGAVRRDDKPGRVVLVQVLDADLPPRRPGARHHRGRVGAAREAQEPPRVRRRLGLAHRRPPRLEQVVHPDHAVERDGHAVARQPDGPDDGVGTGVAQLPDGFAPRVVPHLDDVPVGGDDGEDVGAEQHLGGGEPAAVLVDAAQLLAQRVVDVEDAEVGGRGRREAAGVLVPGDREQPRLLLLLVVVAHWIAS